VTGESFDLEAPDHFTVGAIGPPGQRVFYLQGREGGGVVTLKVEKEQVSALAEYLAGLLAKLLPTRGRDAPGDVELLEPVEAAWAVGSLGVGHDEARDRVLIVASELVEDEDAAGDAASARFQLTRAQATAFVERARAVVKAGRPLCPLCTRPRDPGGHVCARSNGHVAH
jgi:uncharacterized repeat protein (TIGR03847 family)